MKVSPSDSHYLTCKWYFNSRVGMNHLYQRTIHYKVFYTFLFHIKHRGGVRMPSVSMHLLL